MSLTIVLQVVIGLAFMFAVLSLVTSGISELISSVFGMRSHTLEQGVMNLLDDPSEAKVVYGHPLIQSLYKSGRSRIGVRHLPSYMPAAKFALALLDSKVPAAIGKAASPETITSTIDGLPPGRVKDSLDVLWREAQGDARRFRAGVEKWFDDGMERVSGWYKRRIQIILICLGLAVAAGLNANTLTVTERLWVDAPLRNAIVEQAQNAAPPDSADKQQVDAAFDNIQSGLDTVQGLSLPIGWGKDNRPVLRTWWVSLIGWLLTAVAVSLGAPFWFDVLGRAARFRSTGVRLRTAEPASAEREPS